MLFSEKITRCDHSKMFFMTKFHPHMSLLISGLSAVFRLSVEILPAAIIPKCLFLTQFYTHLSLSVIFASYQWFISAISRWAHLQQFFLCQNFKHLKLPLHANFQPKRRWPLLGINYWNFSGHPRCGSQELSSKSARFSHPGIGILSWDRKYLPYRTFVHIWSRHLTLVKLILKMTNIPSYSNTF